MIGENTRARPLGVNDGREHGRGGLPHFRARLVLGKQPGLIALRETLRCTELKRRVISSNRKKANVEKWV